MRHHVQDVHDKAGPSSDRESSDEDEIHRCRHCGNDYTQPGLEQHLKRNRVCAPLHKAWRRSRDMTIRQEPGSDAEGHIEPIDEHMRYEIEILGEDGVVPYYQDEGLDAGGDVGMGEGMGMDEGMGMGEGPGPGPGGDNGEGGSQNRDEDEDEDESDDDSGEENAGSDADSDIESSINSQYMLDNANMMDFDGLPNDDPASDHGIEDEDDDVVLQEVVDKSGYRYYIQTYPSPTAGEPIRQEDPNPNQDNYPDVGELKKPECFEIAQLLMVSGVSGNFRNKYLRLKRLRGLMPWKNNRALLKNVDQLPRGPDWNVQAIRIPGDRGQEIVELWMRNALDIVKQLLQDKRLGKFMDFKAKKKWTSPARTERVRDEINTADWMWEVQAEIEVNDEHGTVIPIIISSDETKLTSFSGDKKAHPVYLTIGNLPKRLRRRTSKRGNVLLGYLPVAKLDCVSDKEMRRFQRRDLFHKCMGIILAPLREACETGVEALCADGGVRRIYPALASYIADFPEQCKVACTKGTHCPLCTVGPDQRGDLANAPPRTRDKVINAMDEHKVGGSAAFERLGLYDVEPFWKHYRYVNIGCLMTPDLLHQVHKGVMKDHLTKWVTHVLGKQVIDERHTTMPEYHGLRHFKNGISTVSQWTGRELKEMAKVLLPVMSDADPQVVTAGRALMDFMYLAHSSSLTDRELDSLQDALRTFHANKEVFKRVGAVKTKKAFHGIPKIHMIQHYVHLIKMLGTPDGYNTETSERLHIDFAKMGYRASNKVNAIKQMALYIQRIEAIAMHEVYLENVRPAARAGRENQEQNQAQNQVGEEDILDEEGEDEDWDEWFEEEEEEDPAELEDAGVRIRLETQLDEFLTGKRAHVGGGWDVEQPQPGDRDDQGPRYHPAPDCVLADTPTIPSITLERLSNLHGAPQLRASLVQFLRRQRPGTRRINELITPDVKLSAWSRARLFHSPPPFKPSEGPHIDVVRTQPAKVDAFERLSRPARFDTVLIIDDKAGRGVHRYRPARVRAIFELPARLRHIYNGRLAFVELFYATCHRPLGPTGLFTTSRTMSQGVRLCAVIPLSDIRMTCHLVPRYNLFALRGLTLYSDVLRLCDKFFLNIFVSYFCYELFRHWSQEGSDV
ncbi:hypothetical protein FRC09_011011 [Ceratobasidium sp. 395]|nr:hypothetical protein FRC09_011011 [Ceratobasidium sp. 395]